METLSAYCYWLFDRDRPKTILLYLYAIAKYRHRNEEYKRTGNGGGFKKNPFTRPSIHNHPGCIFAEGELMYVTHCRNVNRERNVFKNKHVATEEFKLLRLQVNEKPVSDVSQHLTGVTLNKSNINQMLEATLLKRRENQKFNQEESINHQEEEINQSPPKIQIYRYAIVVAVFAVCSIAITMGIVFDLCKFTYDHPTLSTDLSNIRVKYNIDEKPIQQIKAGITKNFKQQGMGSLMFIYDSNGKSVDLNKFNKIINDISHATTRFLSNKSTPLNFKTVEGTQLEMEPRELISRYKAEMATTGVLLVRHLEAVPARLAMAVHYYCSEYNPVVKSTAIFFTFNLASCPAGTGKKSSHSFIKKCLAVKWNNVSANNIAPILARITNDVMVIDITSSF